MKNRRLIILLSVLAFFCVVVVLSSTLFTMKYVSVNWLSTKHVLSTLDDVTLVDSATLPYGNSIFLINKNQIKADYEKANPYLKIVSIETKFPNKLVFHTVERMVFFGVKISDSKYALVDEEGKVLQLVGESYFSSINGTSDGYEYDAPVKVIIDNYAVPSEAFVLGEIMHADRIVDIVQKIAYSLRESGYDATMCAGIFDSISIVVTGDKVTAKFTTDYGLKISIDDMDNLATDKIILGLSLYNELHDDSIVDGIISVWYSTDRGKPIATFNKN